MFASMLCDFVHRARVQMYDWLPFGSDQSESMYRTGGVPLLFGERRIKGHHRDATVGGGVEATQ